MQSIGSSRTTAQARWSAPRSRPPSASARACLYPEQLSPWAPPRLEPSTSAGRSPALLQGRTEAASTAALPARALRSIPRWDRGRSGTSSAAAPLLPGPNCPRGPSPSRQPLPGASTAPGASRTGLGGGSALAFGAATCRAPLDAATAEDLLGPAPHIMTDLTGSFDGDSWFLLRRSSPPSSRHDREREP